MVYNHESLSAPLINGEHIYTYTQYHSTYRGYIIYPNSEVLIHVYIYIYTLIILKKRCLGDYSHHRDTSNKKTPQSGTPALFPDLLIEQLAQLCQQHSLRPAFVWPFNLGFENYEKRKHKMELEIIQKGKSHLKDLHSSVHLTSYNI